MKLSFNLLPHFFSSSLFFLFLCPLSFCSFFSSFPFPLFFVLIGLRFLLSSHWTQFSSHWTQFFFGFFHIPTLFNSLWISNLAMCIYTCTYTSDNIFWKLSIVFDNCRYLVQSQLLIKLLRFRVWGGFPGWAMLFHMLRNCTTGPKSSSLP